MERETETETERHRQTETETQRERGRETETQREKDRQRDNPCFRNFGELFFSPFFVFIIFSCRQLKYANSFCFPKSTTANVLKPFCVVLSVHWYFHVTTIESDFKNWCKIPMFFHKGLFRLSMIWCNDLLNVHVHTFR